jgi:NADPH:quinone reductase
MSNPTVTTQLRSYPLTVSVRRLDEHTLSMTDSSMRAWRARSHGEPDIVLETSDVARPVPGADQVLVEVRACGINFADGLLCRGTYQQDPGLPLTPGLEVAGVIAQVGSEVDDLVVGERVVGSTELPFGGMAQFCLARRADLFGVPERLSFELAAATHITHHTAWVSLVHRAPVAEGSTVLVRAGAGGTGGACVAMAASLGARVIATAGGPDKLDECRRLGASVVVDHRRDDVLEAVRDTTDGRGVEVVIDPVGGADLDLARKACAFEGRIVVLGFASGQVPLVRANHLMVRNVDVVGVQWPTYRRHRPDLVARAQEHITEALVSGTLVAPRVVRRDFDAAPQAITELLSGKTLGKLVLAFGDRASPER